MPPPAEARVLRAVRPVTLTILAAQISREIEHITAAKVQNARIEAVFKDMQALKTQAAALDTRIKTFNQLALDALVAGDQALVKSHLFNARALGDELAEVHRRIGEKADEGLRLEEEDVRREFQRGHEAGIKKEQIVQMRRQPDRWRPEGPNGDGPGAA